MPATMTNDSLVRALANPTVQQLAQSLGVDLANPEEMSVLFAKAQSLMDGDVHQRLQQEAARASQAMPQNYATRMALKAYREIAQMT
jgi:hypothetical protein